VCYPAPGEQNNWSRILGTTKRTLGVNDRERSKKEEQMAVDPVFEISQSLLKLLDLASKTESNTRKTKHAVRAFVLFLFYQLSFTTVAVFIWNLSLPNTTECIERGACSSNIFLQFLAAVLWIVGISISSRIGWQEIRRSD
jgi:hypothetical protein